MMNFRGPITMRLKNSFILFIVTLFLVSLYTCKSDKGTPELGAYPTAVGKIIVNKCAVPGCHDSRGSSVSAGLDLSTWETMFRGSDIGADLIPFRSDFSSVLSFVNTYPDLGLSLLPIMPYGKTALTRDEVLTLKNLINQGAPNENGFVKFSDNPLRKKIYLTNQGCDVVTVFDEASSIQMRYVSVGKTPAIESPHEIQVSPDGKYWYVLFNNGNFLQRFNTSDDSPAGEIDYPVSGNWNTMTISSDSKDVYVVDYSPSAWILHLDLVNMTVKELWGGSSNNIFISPHGSEINKTNDTVYITAQTGNFIYKIPVNNWTAYTLVSLQPGQAPVSTSSLDIHEMTWSPDHSKYFVTCQKSDEVRIVKTSNDSVLAVIKLNKDSFPQDLSISTTTNYLFVTCQEDTITKPGSRGSVAVIDYVNNSLVTQLFTGWQPNGISVDDAQKLVFVANRNLVKGGPAPHHTGYCGGRNGYVTFIDMNTLLLVRGANNNEKRTEVSVDPYSMTSR